MKEGQVKKELILTNSKKVFILRFFSYVEN